MTFLHSEFFLWMIPPVLVLFYFWQTQTPQKNRLFHETVLAKLHAPEITMGLQARNTIFLIAALLLIAAMAQPAILQDAGAGEREVKILIAMDLSKKSSQAFEEEKQSVLKALQELRGETIAVIGYDVQSYRIVPYTTDTDMIVALVKGLDPETLQSFKSDQSIIEKFRPDGGVTMVIGDPIERDNSSFQQVKESIEHVRKSQRLYAHIPLFYYPLGLAMILIWIALSSMSRRRSVTLLALLFLSLNSKPSYAGLMDFQTLRCGYEAYEAGRYAKSAVCFNQYRQSHDSPQVRYNLANALYKTGSYGQALYWYRQVYTTDPILARRTAYNAQLCEAKIRYERQNNGMRKGRDHPALLETKELQRERKRGQPIKTRLYPM